MRRCIRPLFLLLIAPAIALAATAPTVDQDQCRSNSLTIEKGKIQLTRKEPSTYKKCKEALAKKATSAQLEKEKLCGTVTFQNASGDTCPAISKCDPKYKEKLAQCLKKAAFSITGEALKNAADEIASTGTLSPETQDGLKKAFGLSDEQVQNITTNVQDPEKWRGLGEAFETGDPEKIKEAAAGLGISEETLQSLKDRAAKLSDPDKALETVKDLLPEEAQEPFRGLIGALCSSAGGMGAECPESWNTFAGVTEQEPTDQRTLMERAKYAISCIESRCGNYFAKGPITRNGDRAYGKYQVMGRNIPSWTLKALGYAMTPEQLKNCSECQEKVFEVQYGGYVSQCGSYEGAAAKWFTGSCTPASYRNDGITSAPTYVRKFAQVFYGNNQPIPFAGLTSAYTRTAGSPFAAVNPWQSYVQDQTTSEYYPASLYSRAAPSGYAQAAPQPQPTYVRSAAPAPTNTTPAGYTYQQPTTALPQPTQVSSLTLTPPEVSPTTQSLQLEQALKRPGASPSASPSVPLEPAAAIIVQPQSATRGQSVVVSWSSVGMSTANPCNVYVRAGGTNVALAKGNEGSRSVPIVAKSVSGTWNFDLICTSVGGKTIERTASAEIK